MTSHRTATGIEAIEFLRHFVSQLRLIPALRTATIIFSCERNSAHEASHLANAIKIPQLEPVYLYTENAYNPDDYGKRTTDVTKVSEVRATQHMIQTTKPGFLKNWLASNPFISTTKDNRVAMMKKLSDQMERYNIRPALSSYNSVRPRYIVTGKMDPDGNKSINYHDDIIVCLCMCVGLYYDVLTDSLDRKFSYISERKNRKKK